MGILVRLDTACCGCTVRSVTLFLLYVSLVCSILSFSGGTSDSGNTGVKNAMRDIITQLVNEKDPAQREAEINRYSEAISKWGSSYNHISQIISLIIIVVTLYGVHAKRAPFMIPYLVYNGVVLIIMAVVFAILLIVILVIVITAHASFMFFVVLTFILSLIFAISYYIYIIIYNCYRQIKENKHAPGVITYAA